MRLTGYELYRYELAYDRPVRWFNSVEASAEYVALRLRAEDGSRGFAEIPIKTTWHGLSAKTVGALVEDVLFPALADTDPSDASAVTSAMAPFPCAPEAKALISNACAVLAASACGQPLWGKLGGKQDVEVSWCVTRQTPAAMAREAEEMVASYGFRSLKLKGGQGFDLDCQMIRDVRKRVGSDVILSVDANGAYSATEALSYMRLLTNEGVAIAEDPCILPPEAAFSELVEHSPLPLLVDMPCTSVATALAFIQAGAGAISIKPGRIGLSDAIEIAALSKAAGILHCSGMFAESAIGSLVSLAFSSSLEAQLVPAEQSFFLKMEQKLHSPLIVKSGRVLLPEDSDLDGLIDWARMQRFA